jgi:predicted O-linked N-acetylglucosamine transferase (SPINDLY family)
MGYYRRLDIALDPVDVHTGATTTCDALWMGVPVITKQGDRMGLRMTATTLTAIGHPEWIARSDEEYVEKAVALARDVDRRNALRRTLREEMARSPLCDARDLAKSLEDAYVAMYERWLAGQSGRNS